MMKKLTATILTLALALSTGLPGAWADTEEITPADPTTVVQEIAADNTAEATEEAAAEAKIAGVSQFRDELNQLQKERKEHQRIVTDLKSKSETIDKLKGVAKENGEVRKLEKARIIEKEIHQIMDKVDTLRDHKSALWVEFHGELKAGHLNRAEQILQNILRDKSAINTLLHGVEKLMNAEIVVLK